MESRCDFHMMEFLEARLIDGKEFKFQYSNNKGETSQQIAKNVEEIIYKKNQVKLNVGNSIYTYNILRMQSVCFDEKMKSDEFTSSEKNYSYLIKIIDKLIEENIMEHGEENANALNYSFDFTKNKVLKADNKKFNKKILKKYMTDYKAEKISNKEGIFVYPFATNLSQKEAINNAFVSDVSVIQGPPGTGKTQTILNIICNAISRKERVLVVSNNNSAIDNVKEKLENLSELLTFFVRLGNKKDYINPLEKILQNKISKDSCQQSEETLIDREFLMELNKKIKLLEHEYEKLIVEQNTLNELITQKRHIDLKIKTYGLENTINEVSRFFLMPSQLVNEIKFIRKLRIKEMNILHSAYFRLRFRTPKIDVENYTMYEWRLEKIYAEKMITYLENKIKEIPNIKAKLDDYYKTYQIKSICYINMRVSEWFEKQRTVADEIINQIKNGEEFWQIRDNVLNLYPVVLTTLDSVVSNTKSFHKFDLVIIDEASQANIVTALPALNSGQRLVVVGDVKQLSHIVNSDMEDFDEQIAMELEIAEKYRYSKINLLESILEVFKPPQVLLKEHYRCDYNIINFCNKKYYNSELLIYSNQSLETSLKMIPINKEKNSDSGLRKNGKHSFFNRLEEKEIVKYLEGEQINEEVSVITPFRKQVENLLDVLPAYEKNIGTVYKFQGRENKKILFSTVLTKETNIPIDDETINVAVSRAENELVLFTHDLFFKETKHELKDLIEYIETYGEVLEAKVNSIFAYLYKGLRFYKSEKDYDSLWEKKLHQELELSLNKYVGFYIQMKLPVSDIARDKTFLDNNPELKQFALNKNSHLDFVIVHELTNKPILVIELDGKHHKEEEQKYRDQKKERILCHHEIPLWRILSTDAVEREDIQEKISRIIYDTDFSKEILKFLVANEWKK